MSKVFMGYVYNEHCKPLTCCRPSCDTPIALDASLCDGCKADLPAVFAEIEALQAGAREERLARKAVEK